MKMMRRECVSRKLPVGLALLFAGSQYGPYTCIPLSAHQGTAALSNRPVNDSLSKFSNALNIEMFFLGNQISSSSHFSWLLLGERVPPP